MRFYFFIVFFAALTLSLALPAFAEGADEGHPVDIDSPQTNSTGNADQDKLPGEPKKPCGDVTQCDGGCPRP